MSISLLLEKPALTAWWWETFSQKPLDDRNGMWLDTSVPETTTNGPADRLEKGDSTMETFAVSVIAADEADASERVARRLPEGFGLTGRAAVTDAKHMLCSVEVANNGGDVNDAWVVLTSYGMTPADGLGSAWQTVAGVGC